jgi:hypothetical protein
MRTVLMAISTLAMACGGGDGDPDAGNPDAACPGLWEVSPGVGGAVADAVVTGGALEIDATNAPEGPAISIAQTGITGDFSATFTFAEFTAGGGTGGFAQALVVDTADPITLQVVSGIGINPIVGVSAGFVVPAGTVDLQETTAVSGTMRLARTGTTLTATTTVGATSATASGTASQDPLKIGIQVGSNDGTATGTSIRILDFSITDGGGAVASDAFDCDSLQP